jgi:UDP-glucose 4-epimerase
MNNTIVVTGSSGYIGGTICYLLKQKGYKVVAIDCRPQPHLHQYYDVQIVDDFCSYNSFLTIKNNEPAAIIHCAGTSLVGPSLHDPGPYFHNNLNKTQSLLDFLANEKINTKIIFSSSAAVYGDYDNSFDEYSETKPISPYGESKLMIETSLKWYKKIFGLDYVAFRYFNACGAIPGGIHGQEPDATHIFAKLFDAAIKDESFTLNGIYKTPSFSEERFKSLIGRLEKQNPLGAVKLESQIDNIKEILMEQLFNIYIKSNLFKEDYIGIIVYNILSKIKI